MYANITSSSSASPPPHTFSRCLTFHRGTMNPTQSIGAQDTYPTWTDKTLPLYYLINELSRKFPLFSPPQAPHHCAHTHSREALPFTEAQRTQPGPPQDTPPIWVDKNLRLYGLTFLEIPTIFTNYKTFSEIPTFFTSPSSTSPPPHTYTLHTYAHNSTTT